MVASLYTITFILLMSSTLFLVCSVFSRYKKSFQQEKKQVIKGTINLNSCWLCLVYSPYHTLTVSSSTSFKQLITVLFWPFRGRICLPIVCWSCSCSWLGRLSRWPSSSCSNTRITALSFSRTSKSRWYGKALTRPHQREAETLTPTFFNLFRSTTRRAKQSRVNAGWVKATRSA